MMERKGGIATGGGRGGQQGGQHITWRGPAHLMGVERVAGDRGGYNRGICWRYNTTGEGRGQQGQEGCRERGCRREGGGREGGVA